MRSRVFYTGALVAAVITLTSCGSSRSSDATTPTTLFQKNAAIIPTTTLPGKGAAPKNSTTLVVSSTVAPATTLVPIVPAVVVADPNNFVPTYLASTNALGAPRPILPIEASFESNTARSVSSTLRTDADGVLTVTAASWVGVTPMTLRWIISTATGSLQCDNCAFVTPKTKRLIKEVTAVKLDGSGIKSIRGLDPMAIKIGQFLGNGWGAEFIVGEPGDIEAGATGNAIRNLLLSCTGTAAATCKNVSLGVAEMKWKNQVWATSNCTSALRNGGPRQLIDRMSTVLKGVSVETAALVKQRSALDRVVVGLPAYRPVFSNSGTTRTLTGFASTGCVS